MIDELEEQWQKMTPDERRQFADALIAIWRERQLHAVEMPKRDAVHGPWWARDADLEA